MSRPVVVVSGRHRPHEIFLLVVALVVGVAYTVGAPPPGSIAALLPGWALLIWTVGLALSGLIGLAGVLWSMRLEQAGMLIGAGALVWYVASVSQFGWTALFAGFTCAAWAGANVWRAAQIRRDLRGGR